MFLLHAQSSALQLIQVCIIFVVVLAITYLTTKFVAGYQKGIQVNRNIQVLDTIKIAANKYVQVIKVAERYFVIGISKDNITMLAELSGEDARMLQTPGSGKQFSDSLNEVIKKIKDKLPNK